MAASDSSLEYPEPLMVIKPDLQINELFDDRELKSLRQELKFFTEDELQAAIFQAQAEINAELLKKQTAINRYPPKNVKIKTVRQESPKKSGKHDEETQQPRKEESKSKKQAVMSSAKLQRFSSNSSDENKSVVIIDNDNYGYDDDDFDDSNQEDEENDESEDNMEDTTENGHEDSEDYIKEESENDDSERKYSSNSKQNIRESRRNSPAKNKNNNNTTTTTLDQTLHQLFDDSSKKCAAVAGNDEMHQLPVVENPQFCEQEDLQQICMILDNTNSIFDQLFQCIHVNKSHSDTLDDLEVERSNKRSKEFESRFNRAIYQLERDMRALQKISRNYGDFIDVVKLKGLLRSCGRLLEMILHYIPLSGGAFFPNRIQIFIEILVECGTLVSRVDTCTCSLQLATLARNLRKLDTMVIKYEKEKLEVMSQSIKNSSKATRQPVTKAAFVPKTSHQRSNMARLRKMKPTSDASSFNLSRARSSSRLNMTNKSSKAPTTSNSNNSSPYHLQNNNKNGAKGAQKRAKSADFTAKSNRTMSSLHNNTTNQQMSFDEFGANEDLDMISSKAVGVQCAQSTCDQSVGVQNPGSTGVLQQKDKGVQQGEAGVGHSRSVSRNSIYNLDVPLSSRYDEVASMDRVLSRIHNLELLALRQNSTSRASSSHTNVPQPHFQNQYGPTCNKQPLLSTTNTTANIPEIHTLDRTASVETTNETTIITNNDVTRKSTNDVIRKSAKENLRKPAKVNTSSLIARLEMMKSDFLLMEQKYC